MAYKEITTLSAEKTTALGGVDSKTGKPNPTKVEGFYLGSRSIVKEGATSTLYYFKTATGNVAVWSKTDLAAKMAEAVVGRMTLATCTGKVKVPKGNMYTYSVQQDDTNTIEVSDSSSKTTGASYQDNESEEEDDSSPTLDNDDQIDPEDEDRAQAAALAAAERKAKVNALLKGKR